MALKPAGGKYEGVWINELKNGDISWVEPTQTTSTETQEEMMF